MIATTLNDLFLSELKVLYDAEMQLTKELPRYISFATCHNLPSMLEEHNSVTTQHVARLLEVFKLAKLPVDTRKCETMTAILKETQSAFDIIGDDVRDVLLISSNQKIEHYEISSYATVCIWARELKLPAAGKLLVQSLCEEKLFEETLNSLADTRNLPAELRDRLVGT